MSSSREKMPKIKNNSPSPSESPSYNMFRSSSNSAIFSSLSIHAERAASPNVLLDLSGTIIDEQPAFTEEKTQNDPFPPVLPVLNEIFNMQLNEENADFSNYIFVCGQHNLNTTASLFQELLKLNAQKENIFVVGKSYSNNERVAEWLRKHTTHIPSSKQYELGNFVDCYKQDIYNLWVQVANRIVLIKNMHKKIEGLIILDDGGHVLSSVPDRVRTKCPHIIGIEQTSSGIQDTKGKHFPTIMVAASAIKNEIEPPMVADVVAEKVKENIIKITSADFIKRSTSTVNLRNFQSIVDNKENLVFGIIGYGHIGKAVINQLHAMGYKKFTILEQNPIKRLEIENLSSSDDREIFAVTKLENLIGNSNVIIGCTGTDITANSLEAFQAITTPKVLLSCSSTDVEFRTLLKYISDSPEYRDSNSTDVLDDIIFKNGFRSPIMILRGGFPINFDNSEVSVKECDIEIIRGLKLQSILQAYRMIEQWKVEPERISKKSYMLDAYRQLRTLNLWLKHNRPSKAEYCNNFLEKFSHEYILKNSSGEQFQSIRRSNSIHTASTNSEPNSATNSPLIRPLSSANHSPASQGPAYLSDASQATNNDLERKSFSRG